MVGNAGVLLRAVLAGQAAGDIRVEVASGVDPVEGDVGRSHTSESAKNKSSPHSD